MAKVIDLASKCDFEISCPECGCFTWFLKVDGLGDKWKNITGTECSGCGYTVDWIFVKREEVK